MAMNPMIIPSQNLRSLRLCRCLNVGKYIISGPTSSTSQMVHGFDDLPTKTASKRSLQLPEVRRFGSFADFLSAANFSTEAGNLSDSKSMVEIQ